jgi:hypothetical protein
MRADNLFTSAPRPSCSSRSTCSSGPTPHAKSIRFWKTPVADCGWGGRKDCMDIQAWNNAWASITG